MAATSGRQENGQPGPQADPLTAGHEASSQVSCQAPENEWQDIVEEERLPPPPQTERRDYQELTYQCCRSTGHFWELCLHELEEALEPARHGGAIREDDHRHDKCVSSEKKTWQYACRVLGMSSFKEGAMRHDGWKLT
jgi:hypothetical protein